MSEVLSWREENWWERKSVPFGSHSLSPRTLFLILAFGWFGDYVSAPFPSALFGIFYLGRAIPIIVSLAIGIVLGTQRIRMIPVELQLLVKVTSRNRLPSKPRLQQEQTTQKDSQTIE